MIHIRDKATGELVVVPATESNLKSIEFLSAAAYEVTFVY